MPDVRVDRRGNSWYVFRDEELVGRYRTEQEAADIVKIAKYADKFPPESGQPGVTFRTGRWEFTLGGKSYRFTNLTEALREHKKHLKEQDAKKPKPHGSGCAKCVWRLVFQESTSGKHYHCGYSLCYGHHSRVWLHYHRTGKESLDGFITGEGCPEFMTGNPKDKLSLMQDNPARITDKAWALLARERGIELPKKKKAERKSYCTTTDLDMDKAKELKARYKWREIAQAAGLSVNGAKGCWERQRINKQAAKRLLDAFGVDITIGGKQK